MFAKRWLSVFLRAYGVLATLAGRSVRLLSTFTGSQDEALDDPISGYAIDKLFDRFYSLPSGKGQKGSGIGLSLAREVARPHGATVTILRVCAANCARKSVYQLGGMQMLWGTTTPRGSIFTQLYGRLYKPTRQNSE
jgi:hypothetical protein